MCLFITATLSSDANLDALRPLITQHQLEFAPLDNPHVREQLEPGEGYFHASGCHCDCESTLGSHPSSREPVDREVRRHLRRKGWSEAKIQRWLDQQKAIAARNERVARQQGGRPTPSLRQWEEALRALIDSGHTSHVGLLLHDFQGSLSAEVITVLARESIPVEELSAQYLLGLRKDVLYRFGRR
ncbi:MAG: hypothetical protein CMJ83_22395 [Planctomycetes bacterium]|nr:hypothetical protein [Planctomycetota bacterium]